MLAQFLDSSINIDLKPVVPAQPVYKPLPSYSFRPQQNYGRKTFQPPNNNKSLNYSVDIIQTIYENTNNEIINLEHLLFDLKKQRDYLADIIKQKNKEISEKPIINDLTNDGIQYNKEKQNNDINKIYDDQNTEELTKIEKTENNEIQQDTNKLLTPLPLELQ